MVGLRGRRHDYDAEHCVGAQIDGLIFHQFAAPRRMAPQLIDNYEKPPPRKHNEHIAKLRSPFLH
eukprot:2142487-Pyramimonas_sp.AAC.1